MDSAKEVTELITILVIERSLTVDKELYTRIVSIKVVNLSEPAAISGVNVKGRDGQEMETDIKKKKESQNKMPSAAMPFYQKSMGATVR